MRGKYEICFLQRQKNIICYDRSVSARLSNASYTTTQHLFVKIILFSGPCTKKNHTFFLVFITLHFFLYVFS